jgi:membrane-associated phospholipid phosphatase
LLIARSSLAQIPDLEGNDSKPLPAVEPAPSSSTTAAPAAPSAAQPTLEKTDIAGRNPHPFDSTVIVSKDAPPALVWKWQKFSTPDYLVTVTGGAITLAMAIVSPRPQHVTGGLWFDDDVRNTLRAHSLANRYIFRDASDVGLSLAVTWPFMADALTAAWWYRGSRESAQEMALIDMQTLAVVGAIQGATNVLVSRERPYGRDCGSEQLPSDAIDCSHSAHYRSFFSGHSAFSFTGAALICVHHFENELLGEPWDTLSCAGGYAVAATTATFRVVSDVHYASDVLTGALMGTLVGYGIPLLHYSHRGSATTTLGSLQLNVVPAPGGIGVLGIF